MEVTDQLSRWVVSHRMRSVFKVPAGLNDHLNWGECSHFWFCFGLWETRCWCRWSCSYLLSGETQSLNQTDKLQFVNKSPWVCHCWRSPKAQKCAVKPVCAVGSAQGKRGFGGLWCFCLLKRIGAGRSNVHVSMCFSDKVWFHCITKGFWAEAEKKKVFSLQPVGSCLLLSKDVNFIWPQKHESDGGAHLPSCGADVNICRAHGLSQGFLRFSFRFFSSRNHSQVIRTLWSLVCESRSFLTVCGYEIRQNKWLKVIFCLCSPSLCVAS